MNNIQNTELPIDVEQQILMMKKYVVFHHKKKLRLFLEYAGYFRASRYGKFLLSHVGDLGTKANLKMYFDLYAFDCELRRLLFTYCKKAEIKMKSVIANALAIKTQNVGFYLEDEYYTPSKSENDKKKRIRNVNIYKYFITDIREKEVKLRKDVAKHPELKEYRRGGNKYNNCIPVWAAFSYFEFGTIVTLFSYLRGDLRKEVINSMSQEKRYKKEMTKQLDTWLDAIRNLRNYCAHHSMLVGMTSSVVIKDNRDSTFVLPEQTDLFSRLYALKKVLNESDAECLKAELKKLIKKTKLDIYKLRIIPANWENLYENIIQL